MRNKSLYPVPSVVKKKAHIDAEKYAVMYQQSLQDPQGFWAEQAKLFLDWYQSWETVQQGDFTDLNIKWFSGAKLNACYNCVDRHLPQRADQIALIWEGDEPNQMRTMTYQVLYDETCRFAQVLKNAGVRKGDRVCLYMPMILEAVVAMLACARMGAVHSVVFGGFSPQALRGRIDDAACQVVITADAAVRGGKQVPLKANTDSALTHCGQVKHVIVVKHASNNIDWNPKRDIWYHEAMQDVPVASEPEWMDAEDPLFILYTSGSTGKPKGVMHTTAGYLLYVAMTHKYVFDYHDGEIYWCTADVGWITGHSYGVYGPLANGATTLIFAGLPTYPTVSRYWEVIDKHQVNIFYTAPTAIRAVLSAGDEPVRRTQRSSLRILGTVGEPINPDVWRWYYDVVGNGRCQIVDTWWQTETGGIVLTPLPGATDLKPGSACGPFFGIEPAIVDTEGMIQQPSLAKSDEVIEGRLVITKPWPGMLRTIWGDQQRFIDTYFKEVPGMYCSGDGARLDTDGYYWITGRVDDVINVAGPRKIKYS